MTTEPDLHSYLESLRQSLPSATDEARIRQRLTAAGLAVGVALASQTAAASSATLAKVGFMSALSVRFASLSLVAQMGLITAGTTVVASIPIVAVNHYQYVAQRATAPAPSPVVGHGAPAARVAADSTAAKPEATPPLPVQPETAPPRPSRDGRANLSVQAPRLAAGPAPVPLAIPERRTDVEVGVVDEQRPAAVDRASTFAMARSADQESTLAQETRLIDAALLAIRDGNWALAHQRLTDHARLFPSGRLMQERLRAEQQLAAASRRGNPR